MGEDAINQVEAITGIRLIALQKWHLVVILIGAIFTIGMTWGISQGKIDELKAKNEAVASINRQLQQDVNEMKDSINEIKFNLKNFMIEYKINYIER